MGILIIHADHETTPSEWVQVQTLLRQFAPHETAHVVPTTPAQAVQVATPVASAEPTSLPTQDERLHDPLGEYDDATWQSFSPQKRGSIKRHRNGNDAPFVQAAQASTPQPAAATPATDAMAELFALSGIAQPSASGSQTPQTDVESIQTTPVPVAQRETTPQPVKLVMPESARDLTPGERSTLAIWANRDMRPAGQEDRGLADPNKVKVVNAYLGGAVTLTQVNVFGTKSGKSTLAKDMARVVKRDLPAALVSA